MDQHWNYVAGSITTEAHPTLGTLRRFSIAVRPYAGGPRTTATYRIQDSRVTPQRYREILDELVTNLDRKVG